MAWYGHCERASGSLPLTRPMTRKRISQLYFWSVVAVGAGVLVFSFAHLTREQLDVRFMLLALATVLIGPRLCIPIPRVKAHISVSDTFVFLSLLLFGGEVAILLATVEAVCASVRIGRLKRTHFFNAAVMACTTFLTVWTVRLLFGESLRSHDFYSPNYLVMVCTMGLVQYLTNSLLVAVNEALKTDHAIWRSWTMNYLWTSITYLAGASAAGIIARFIGNIGFFAFSATIPI